ncbi:MAG: hypothetical protein LBP27_00050, partial [Treponema sp.]|nr:hypothetical protein [Treponema sp.]
VYRINENSSPVPAIIIHDKDDNIIPFSNSEILHNKLESLHIPNVFIITDKLGHDLGADGKKGVKIINYELETKLIDAIDRIVL